MPADGFDLVVLGGGPAGLAGALAAAEAGRSVALVECAPHVGGAGINTGTIPSKTLRESALVLSGWRARKLLGVDVSVRGDARLAQFLHHERRVVADQRELAEMRLDKLGVRRLRGTGSFVDAHTIAVAAPDEPELRLRAERVLIATGSSPARPPGFPFEHPRVHDSNEILEIEAMPSSLAVVGAGVIGAEYACTFAALGVEVHLIDGREALFPFLDADLSATLHSAMLDAGVRFHWKEKIVRCTPGADGVHSLLSSGTQLRTSDVLVAAGRTSNTAALALEQAGLAAGERGLLHVDEWFRTALPHVYAAGDVIGAPALAGTSMEQARHAMCHAFGDDQQRPSPLLPSGIYTIPEISSVGESEASLAAQGVACVVGRASYRENARGQIIGDERGFLKLVYRLPDLRLVGVHALGEQASELVHVGLVAMLGEGDARLFDRACFNYPTLGDLYKEATSDALGKLAREGRPRPEGR